MKKEWYVTFFYIVSALLALGFCIRLGVDYAGYDAAMNSAPFYVFILERAFEFLLPSVVLLIVARVCKKEACKGKKMKRLLLIGGTMGVGKTAASQELKRLLPRAVFLDGDWCWDADPFVVTDETKAMVLDNIAYLFKQFLALLRL